MEKISYKQARSDHEYLWSIAPAYDMTGAYVDQDDLERLLENPTKAQARDCYCSQIDYWFHAGPEVCDRDAYKGIPWDDPIVREIAERHFIAIPFADAADEPCAALKGGDA